MPAFLHKRVSLGPIHTRVQSLQIYGGVATPTGAGFDMVDLPSHFAALTITVAAHDIPIRVLTILGRVFAPNFLCLIPYRFYLLFCESHKFTLQ